MKKKLIINSLFLINIIMMFNIWFQDENIDIRGTILFDNPIALTCIFFVLIGVWINHHYGIILMNIGWLGFLSMQIFEFMTWHMRMYGGSFDLGLSLKLCHFDFYKAVILCVITYVMSYWIKGWQKHYEYDLKATLV